MVSRLCGLEETPLTVRKHSNHLCRPPSPVVGHLGLWLCIHHTHSTLSHHVPPSVSSQMTHYKPNAMRTARARASHSIPDKAAGGKSLRLREAYRAPSVKRQEKKHLATGAEVERKAAESKTLLLTALDLRCSLPGLTPKRECSGLGDSGSNQQ